ncbi:hypothetical protein [Candidatus Hodarchaeum mangrovi]
MTNEILADNLLREILAEIRKITQQIVDVKGSLENLTHSLLNSPYMTQLSATDLNEQKDQEIPSSLDIIRLQEHRPGIFQTYKAIQKKDGWVSSQEIAETTTRSRGLESRYLTYLAEQGFVIKKRIKSKTDSRATEVLYKLVGVDE